MNQHITDTMDRETTHVSDFFADGVSNVNLHMH